MKTYWLKFKDGSESCCQGESAFDAVQIAEKISGKKVAVPDNLKYRPEESDAVAALPYPASPCVWQFDHPVSGKTPLFCSTPKQCKGRWSCPKSYSCTE